MTEWRSFVRKRREEELRQIIDEEKLNEVETRKFMKNAFREGEVRTVGTDIDKLMPPLSRFGASGRDKKKKGIIEKLKTFFEKFFGIGADFEEEPEDYIIYDASNMQSDTLKVAEPTEGFNEQ